MAMKKMLALGLACCLPTGLSAEDPAKPEFAALGTVSVLVIEEPTPAAGDVLCTRGKDGASADCMAVHRAVLTARVKKVSTLKERSRSL
jgi:hypothetical protein